MWLDKETNASYNFTAPKIAGNANEQVNVMFPTVAVKSPTLSSNAATVEIECAKTIVDLGADNLAAAATLTLTPGENIQPGDEVLVKWSNGGTKYDVTVKKDAATTVGTLVGVANTTVTKRAVWSGSAWLIVS